MNQKQFEILASKMHKGALKFAALCVMEDDSIRQCDAARLYGVSKQSLNQAIKRLKKRAAEFEAMGRLKL